MNVQGPGGSHPIGVDATDAGASATPLHAEVAAAVVRSGPAVPANVQKGALAFDQAHHKNRNIPDFSFGPTLVDGKKNTDGSWTVNVGSMPTSIMGPRPGAKPFDIVTYTVSKAGKVTVGGSPQTPHWADPGLVLNALKSHDSKGHKQATDFALAAATGLYTGGMGFPRMVDKPDAMAVARFKNLLSALQANGKLGDLHKAISAEEKREHDAITGGGQHQIPDWYGPATVMGALMNKYGTKTQKAEYAGR